ncbi:MAG: hypothetical protein ACYC2Z_07735 [Candidatus Nanopelagicales bacterium]
MRRAHKDSGFARAAAHPDWQVRAEAANRDDCPPPVLDRLSHDPDPVVRRAAIAHPCVPIDVLVRTLLSGRSRLDAEVAAKHAALVPHDNIEALLAAASYGARGLLQRADLPGVLVRAYAGAAHGPLVRRLAIMHPNCPPDVLGTAADTDPAAGVRAAAAAQVRCPAEALSAAARDPDDDVRLACAGNAGTPATAIDRLARDPDERIRGAAVLQPAAPSATLARAVSADPSLAVRRAVLGNPACPAGVIDAACGDVDLMLEATALEDCTGDGHLLALVTARSCPRPATMRVPDEGARASERDRRVSATIKRCVRALARQPWGWLSGRPLERLDAEDLAGILTRHLAAAASDDRQEIRLAVCRHPHAAPGLLARLAADPDPLVREAVSQRILAAALGAG